MGLLFNSNEEIEEKVKEAFGDEGAYLVVFKHNSAAKGLIKLLLSKLYYVFDSTRTFILHFGPKGIYESEMSNSLKKDFIFMAWNEIEDISIDYSYKNILKINHLGKVYQYEIPYKGKIFVNNEKNMEKLLDNDWFSV